MINLLTYFKDISPIKNLTIVKSIEDYKENYELCKGFDSFRNNTIISKPSMKSVEHTGTMEDMTSFIEKVKKIDKDGVLVLFNLSNKPSKRYDRYAGISVGVSIGNCVYINAVGKGFDGREVSKGIACHEIFYIPWFELRKCNIENFRDYRTYLIPNNEYQVSRNGRLNFFKKCRFR